MKNPADVVRGGLKLVFVVIENGSLYRQWYCVSHAAFAFRARLAPDLC
jgi:hypothetical protein